MGRRNEDKLPTTEHVVDLPTKDHATVAKALADFLLACLDAEQASTTDEAAE